MRHSERDEGCDGPPMCVACGRTFPRRAYHDERSLGDAGICRDCERDQAERQGWGETIVMRREPKTDG